MKYIEKIKSVFNSIKYIFMISLKYNYKYLVLFIPATLLTAVSPFITILFPKWIIDSITGGKDIRFILMLALVMFTLRLIRSHLSSLIGHAQALNLTDIKTKMTLGIIEKTMNIKYEYLENAEYLDLKERAEKCIGNSYHRNLPRPNHF